MGSPSEDWVTIARLAKTQGRHGELAADILTDIPDRFAQLHQVSLLHPSGRRASFGLAGHWFHKGRVVLALAGVEDMNAAEAWIGAEVQVERGRRAPAPEGSYYLSDLEGCTVYDHERPVGAITEVEAVAGAAPLLHVAAGQGEVLIPFAAAYLEAVSLPERRVAMNLPAGLLDINLNRSPK
ncbi:MAG TPA: ribosome maturation factor RimM [Terriglobales bacterium]|nr:ribosome maturation factor RimM [Terriglobales bacterium]